MSPLDCLRRFNGLLPHERDVRPAGSHEFIVVLRKKFDGGCRRWFFPTADDANGYARQLAKFHSTSKTIYGRSARDDRHVSIPAQVDNFPGSPNVFTVTKES
jgi:hypothetical protein